MIDVINFLELLKNSSGISIDSRKTKENEIFIGLKGDNADGGIYYKQALENGAKACLLNENLNKDNLDKKPPIYFVPDTFEFIKQVAILWRQNFQGKIIAVSGSNGKTTTKNILTKVFHSHYKINSTLENENNFLGVILTMIRTKLENDFLISEIGTNHFGEIQEIVNLLKPDAGVITNLGMEHLEFFKNIEGVAKEELSLAEYLNNESKPIFAPKNDLFLQTKLTKIKPKQLVTYSFNGKKDNVFVKNGLIYLAGAENKKLNLLGQHNAQNISSVFAIADYYKVPKTKIIKNIYSFKPSENRSELFFDKKLKSNFYFDGYNANPSSMAVALETFRKIKLPQPKMAILGCMKELGNASKKSHKELVDYVLKLNFKEIILIGTEYKNCFDEKLKKITFFQTYTDFINSLSQNELKEKNIFLKGSKGSEVFKFRKEYSKLG